MNALNFNGFALCLCPYGGKANISGLAELWQGNVPEVFLIPLVGSVRHGAPGLEELLSCRLQLIGSASPICAHPSGRSLSHLRAELSLIGLLLLREFLNLFLRKKQSSQTSFLCNFVY